MHTRALLYFSCLLLPMAVACGSLTPTTVPTPIDRSSLIPLTQHKQSPETDVYIAHRTAP